tara:strand:+ start:552 stop:2615 length:2064 start_codon:yes stop_codon:yes gene_type:complete
MNRYYNPTPREYVSTHVDMPWEFLQGTAEKKQKGFDTATTGIDAAAKLLDFQVNPGDVPGKQKLQKEYNDRLLKSRDYLLQTGDYSKASVDLTNVVRDIIQDKRLSNMKNAVEPHTKVMAEDQKLRGEGAPSLGLKADPNFATYDPETDKTRPYQQFAGYNAQKTNDLVRKQLEEAMDNVVPKEWGWTKLPSGMYKDEQGKLVTRERLEPLIEKILPSIRSNFDFYLNDLNNQDKKQGLPEGSTFNNLVNSSIDERTFNNQQSKLRERESTSGIKVKEWENRSNIGVTTGATTGEKFSYKGAKKVAKAAAFALSELKKQLNDPKNPNTKTGPGKQKLEQAVQQAELMLVKANENLSSLDDVLENSKEVNNLYEEYKTNMLKSPVTKTLPLISKEEFFKIITDKAPIKRSNVVGADGNLYPSHPTENGILNGSKNDYLEIAHQKAEAGAYTITNQYIQEYNPKGKINEIEKTTKDAIFNGEMYGTIRGSGNLAGNNANDIILKEFPTATREQSSIATIRNPRTNQPEFEFILRNEKGEVLPNGRFIVTPSDVDRDNNASIYTDAFVENARNDYNAGNVKGYKKNIENIALMNYGEDLSQLTKRSNEGLPISKDRPLPIGNRFFVYTDPNDPHIYYMTQGEIIDGKVMLSSNYEKSATIRNPDGSPSNALNYSDITGKLGQEIFMNTGN